ncbi:MAG: nucleotide sugar dehydrogenase [Polyangiaceae bacterium]|nr:nucleotide sugar dehydrogenase [Polyangiaceae bacterium]
MTLPPNVLLDRIGSRTARVGVIGLGYVGLPLLLEFVEQGFPALGFDIDDQKIDALLRGESYIRHIARERVAAAVGKGLDATVDFSRLAACDAILMCVPTPLTDHRDPDLSFVEQTTTSVAEHLRAGQLVTLESTTYPGTTREIVVPILERSGLRAGHDFFVAYSPEREDPANPNFTTRTIPKVVGGLTPACRKVAAALYRGVVTNVVEVSSCDAAEATKILENTFRAVNIALVNELKMVFHRMGIDPWEVIDGAATKPFGFMRFTPGPGLGGHCIPIDPFYLTWKAREFDMPTRFIEMAGEINSSMPYYVCQRLLEGLSQRGLGIRGAKVLIVGLAYKKNVDDDRESPSYKLIEILQRWGAHVDYHDPYVPRIRATRHYPQLAGQESVGLDGADGYDAVLIATDHDGVDWAALLAAARLVIDTRGVYRTPHDKVVPA